jgi:hypothetical protein
MRAAQSYVCEVSGYVVCGVLVVTGPGLWVLGHVVKIRPPSMFTGP